MLRKYGKFYADWRDPQGRRHRKAFSTHKAARKFGEKMRAAARAKKALRPASPSAHSRGRSGNKPRATASASSPSK